MKNYINAHSVCPNLAGSTVKHKRLGNKEYDLFGAFECA